MERSEIIPAIVLAGHALARIAAQDAGNDTPSAQWRVLSILERDDVLRLGALARAARSTQPGMTRLVGDMERQGLVVRAADPADSRATLVSITESGRQAIREWRTELRQVLAPRFADVGEDDWRTLQRAAEILAAHSREQQTTGGTE